ncbi:hypothetical protein EXH51_24035 [Pelomonas saccharophila]|nr:hypothetical protein [Roseateles saccharophilus]
MLLAKRPPLQPAPLRQFCLSPTRCRHCAAPRRSGPHSLSAPSRCLGELGSGFAGTASALASPEHG